MIYRLSAELAIFRTFSALAVKNRTYIKTVFTKIFTDFVCSFAQVFKRNVY
jgi:hypothetical protein